MVSISTVADKLPENSVDWNFIGDTFCIYINNKTKSASRPDVRMNIILVGKPKEGKTIPSSLQVNFVKDRASCIEFRFGAGEK